MAGESLKLVLDSGTSESPAVKEKIDPALFEWFY
jgi:hypothetical protein